VVADGPHTIARVEFLGANFRYTIRAADGATLVADVGPDDPLQVGAKCDVAVVNNGN
jgi:hypothetical protein